MEPLATLFTIFGVIFLLLVLGAVVGSFFTVKPPKSRSSSASASSRVSPGPASIGKRRSSKTSFAA
jgi:hypothetical protein